MSRIQYVNASFSKLSPKEVKIIKPYLSVERCFWKKEYRKGHIRRVQKFYDASLISSDGVFRTGLINKINRILIKKGKEISLDNSLLPETDNDISFSSLKNITLRKYQREFATTCVGMGRGIIIAATGSGKSAMEAAVFSAYPEAKKLLLCHTKSLLIQHESVMKKYGFDISVVGDSKKDTSGELIIATIQSWSRLPQKILNKIDVVIVDENHHINNEKSMYVKTLSKMTNAHIRFGFSASELKDREQKLVQEGCLGPILGRLLLEEAQEKGIIAKVKLKLLDVPFEKRNAHLMSYIDTYRKGIINNERRNKLIAKTALSLNTKNKTCLIYVKEIEHGNILIEMLEDTEFVQGKISGEKREILRNNLNRKKISNIIATTAWKEGIDIPTLNVVINAAGGESEIAILQNIGRGTRIAEGKDTLIIVDFLDHGKYLAEHCISRLSIYKENGWL